MIVLYGRFLAMKLNCYEIEFKFPEFIILRVNYRCLSKIVNQLISSLENHTLF